MAPRKTGPCEDDGPPVRMEGYASKNERQNRGATGYGVREVSSLGTCRDIGKRAHRGAI